MSFQLGEINPEIDFPALARCLFEAYEHPHQKFIHIFFPVHESTQEAREMAISAAAARMHHSHTHDVTSYWQKVVDVETGSIVGGSLWKIHNENPFAHAPALNPNWLPTDGSRAFVQNALESYVRPRARAAQRPHICMTPLLTTLHALV
jgi:hypothetical protein